MCLGGAGLLHSQFIVLERFRRWIAYFFDEVHKRSRKNRNTTGIRGGRRADCRAVFTAFGLHFYRSRQALWTLSGGPVVSGRTDLGSCRSKNGDWKSFGIKEPAPKIHPAELPSKSGPTVPKGTPLGDGGSIGSVIPASEPNGLGSEVRTGLFLLNFNTVFFI